LHDGLLSQTGHAAGGCPGREPVWRGPDGIASSEVSRGARVLCLPYRVAEEPQCRTAVLTDVRSNRSHDPYDVVSLVLNSEKSLTRGRPPVKMPVWQTAQRYSV
jgi:hypothetical protein